MPKLIYVDVNGALVMETRETPASARGVARTSIATGNRLLLSTGYSLPGVCPSLRDPGFHDTITGSRAYVRTGGEVVVDRRIPAGEVSYVTNIYRGRGVSRIWQGPDEFCMSEGFFGSLAGTPDVGGSLWHLYYPRVLPILSAKVLTNTSKGFFVSPYDSSMNYEEFVEIIGPEYYTTPNSVGATKGTTGEFLLTGLTKGIGMRATTRHFGFDMTDTVAIGNSPSGIEILKAAGTSVVMGNTTGAVKSHADLVTSTTDNDRVYRTLETLGLMRRLPAPRRRCTTLVNAPKGG